MTSAITPPLPTSSPSPGAAPKARSTRPRRPAASPSTDGDAGPKAPSKSTSGRWYDGHDTRAQEVRVRLTRNHLEFMPWPPRQPTMISVQPPTEAELAASRPSLPGLRRYARVKLEVGECWPDAETPVVLPDGGTLWLPAGSSLGRALGGQAWTTRLTAHWSSAVACLLLLLALVIWFDRQGAGLAAQVALPLIPKQLDKALGDRVELELMEHWVRPSQIDKGRRAEITGRFQAVADRVFPGLKPRLVFGRMPKEAGFNAFALPNNTIVIFDGMTAALTDDEIIAVLGHEAGHLKHRHSMRRVVQGAGLLTVAGLMVGDFSSVAAGTLATVQTLRYSRNAEREADLEAQKLILREGLPNETLVGVWTKLKAQTDHAHGDDIPEWMSTHPDVNERLESARRAALGIERAR